MHGTTNIKLVVLLRSRENLLPLRGKEHDPSVRHPVAKSVYWVRYLSSHSTVKTNILTYNTVTGGLGSSVSIATDYGLDGPGIDTRWGEIFRLPDRPWGPPNLLYNGYRIFLRGKEWPGRNADPSPPSSTRDLKTEYSYTSTLPKGLCGL